MLIKKKSRGRPTTGGRGRCCRSGPWGQGHSPTAGSAVRQTCKKWLNVQKEKATQKIHIRRRLGDGKKTADFGGGSNIARWRNCTQNGHEQVLLLEPPGNSHARRQKKNMKKSPTKTETIAGPEGILSALHAQHKKPATKGGRSGKNSNTRR